MDEKTGFLSLDFVFQNLTFPYNYGFLPNTLAEDGDPLDAIVFSTEPILPGIMVLVKPIGIFKMKDRGQQDNKLLTVPVVDPLAKTTSDISDVDQRQQQIILDFFTEVCRQKNKAFEPEGFFGKDEAIIEIKKYQNL